MAALVTTGLFPVQFSGGTPSVHIFISSFIGRMLIVPYQLNSVQPDGSKTSLHQGVLTVAPRRTTSTSLGDVQGRTVEVNLDLPHPALKPTVALIGTFQADGADEIIVFVSPDEFVLRGESSAPNATPASRENVRAIFSSRKVAKSPARKRVRRTQQR